MREILFRGKRADNGEWVEGFYLREAGNFIKELPSVISTPTHLIIPDTIGQYTGSTDRNGKKIFEGDIVKEYFENENSEYDYSLSDTGYVFWYQQTSRYLRTSKMFPDDCPAMTERREYEVVGNTHDNPELLK